MQRAGAGDRLAAGALITRHSDRLMALCYRMLSDRGAAEDAVQETFLRLWQHADRWQPKGSVKFSTWLIRVAMNQCLDRLRKSGREISADHLPERVDAAVMADDAMIADEQARDVRLAIADLPARQRQAIILSHFEEMSNIEIADVMEASVEAIEGLLGRGRRQLRAHFLSLAASPARDDTGTNS